jgi:hypothetical protein
MNYPTLTAAEVQCQAYIPPKIQAAFQFIEFAERISGNRQICEGDTPKEGRSLSKDELAVYESALTVLLQYFNDSDPGFGVPQVVKPPDDPENPAKVPVSV